MGRKVVFFGNCQARALADFYVKHLSHGDDVKMVSIDARTPADREILAAAHIVVEQIFDDRYDIWSEGASPDCLHIPWPTVFGGYLWPFATEQHIRSEAHPFTPGGNWGAEGGDSYLNRQIERGVPTDEAVRGYLELDVARHASLDRLLEMHLERQEDRDECSGIDVCSVIRTQLRWERLFHSRAHPDIRLFAVVAQTVCAKLGFSDAMVEEAFSQLAEAPLSFGSNALPMHPRVIEHFRLDWIAPDATYLDPCWGPMTFERWARRYMDFDWSREVLEGMSLADRGQAELAQLTLERGIARCPGAVHGLDALAKLRWKANEADRAELLWKQAAQVNTVNARSLIALGQIQRHQGKLVEMENTWRAAIARFPVPGEVYLELATVVESDGRTTEAKSLREQGATLLRRSRPEIYCANGRFLRGKGDLAGAAEAFRSALALRPFDRVILLELAEVLGGATDTRAEAIAILGRLTTLGSRDFAAFALLGTLAGQIGDVALSEHSLQVATRLRPSDPNVLLALAQLLAETGRVEEIRQLAARYRDAGGTAAHVQAALAGLQAPTEIFVSSPA